MTKIRITDAFGHESAHPTEFDVGSEDGESRFFRVIFTGPDITGKRFFENENVYKAFVWNRKHNKPGTVGVASKDEDTDSQS